MFSSVTRLDLTSDSGHGSACPDIHVVVFTCSVNGSVLEWIMDPPPGYVVSDQVRQIIFPTIGNILPLGVEGFMFQPALTDSSNGIITSTLTPSLRCPCCMAVLSPVSAVERWSH